MNIVILDERSINSGDISWQRYADLGTLTVCPGLDDPRCGPALETAEAMIAVGADIDQALMDRAPKLAYIGILSTGFDFVDLAEARARGIVVTNVPTYGTDSVAQYTMALILEMCHQAGRHDAAVKGGQWGREGRFSFWLNQSRELRGLTLGVVGFGRIGRAVARLGQAFGLNIAPHDAMIRPGDVVDGIQCLSFDEVLAASDILTFHCPLTESTRELVNRETIAKMKPGVWLVNAARGALVRDEDLAGALRSGHVAAAALDVVSPEPIRGDNPLLTAPNILITPHIAWATVDARRRIVELAADNLRDFLAGRPTNVVS